MNPLEKIIMPNKEDLLTVALAISSGKVLESAQELLDMDELVNARAYLAGALGAMLHDETISIQDGEKYFAILNVPPEDMERYRSTSKNLS